MNRVKTRLETVARLLEERAIELLIVSAGSDMAYLLNFFGHPSERPALLLIPAVGRPSLVMAKFEALSLPDVEGRVDIYAYGETDNPYQLVKDAVVKAPAPSSVAVSDQMWAAVVLELQSAFDGASFSKASELLRDARMRKDDVELATLREVGRRTDLALEHVLQSPISSLTELQLWARLRGAMEDQGVTDTWAIVGSGPNGASPHHQSGERVVSCGDAVVLDIGGVFAGYHSDITRTVFVTEAGAEQRAVYAAVQEAHRAGMIACRPNVTCEAVDRAARRVIEDAGYGPQFIHRTGHGVGLDIHEEPYIVQGNTLPLAEGMVFSIEPGIYLEGRFGVRIEDVVAVNASGCEPMTASSLELQIVD